MTTMTATYRVVKTTITGFGPDAHTDEDIVWQGTNTEMLSEVYPPSQIFGADPLGHTEIEDGFIRINFAFQQLVDDEWRKIADPRVRRTPPTALERAIDAENRRNFPGDYITEDDSYDD